MQVLLLQLREYIWVGVGMIHVLKAGALVMNTSDPSVSFIQSTNIH